MQAGARRRSGRQKGWPARQRNSSLLESARQLQALVRQRGHVSELVRLPHERSNWSVPDNCRIKPHHPEELHGEAINLSETCADLEPRVADRPVRFQDELDEGVAMNVRFREVAMNLAYESSRLGR